MLHCMHELMCDGMYNVCMHVCIYVCTYVCMSSFDHTSLPLLMPPLTI